MLVLLCLFMLGQLLRIQVLAHRELSDEGERMRVRQSDLEPLRGRIWDRNGYLLAGNVVQYDISASPALISDPYKTAATLAVYLEMDAGEILDQLTGDALWVRIARGVPKDLGDAIAAKGIVGISVEPVWRRTFPEGILAAHLLGFVNAMGRGYYGVEGYYDEALRGQRGTRVYQRDPWNQIIPLGLTDDEPPQPGVDLVLTLDRTVQALVEEELALALEETGAESGVIIVMDPRTGAILAMAAAPVYDPNYYGEVLDGRVFVNPAVSGQYEPGSVFKVLTVAIALESGMVSPETTFYDAGQIEMGGQVIRNSTRQAYGEVTLTESLVHSLNVEMAQISAMLGPEKFYQGIRAFGIAHRTGVDLAGEVVGELRVPGDWRWHESDLATNAFGQGLAVTPLQMIAAVAAIANDGLLMQPFVVAEKHYPHSAPFPAPPCLPKRCAEPGADERVERARPASIGRAVSPETARVVGEMMAQTVEQGVEKAQVPGYRIAGKTGTAQLPTPFGYDEQKTIASFVGFAPVDDPQVIVLVRLDKPTSSEWGTQTAAPVFARLARQLFVLLEVPPDDVRLGLGMNSE
jgi:cell division protein FtsI/penicillin-binding protein 2